MTACSILTLRIPRVACRPTANLLSGLDELRLVLMIVLVNFYFMSIRIYLLRVILVLGWRNLYQMVSVIFHVWLNLLLDQRLELLNVSLFVEDLFHSDCA